MGRAGKIAAGCSAWACLVAACDAPERSGAGPESHARAAPEALRAWRTIESVLTHPRCANCHPSDGIPKQGDESEPHAQGVRGGPTGRGVGAFACAGCHRDFNLGPPPRAPGAPGWRIPSEEMPLVFEGRSSGELCRQLRDPSRNGGRDAAALLEHVAHDALVHWGFEPGPGRTPVPIPQAEFVAAVRTWIDAGCGCPP